MTTIKATGHFVDPAAAPTISITSGRGNLEDKVEVHIQMRDTGDESTRVLLGWFPAAELQSALMEAIAQSAKADTRRRLSEPAEEAA